MQKGYFITGTDTHVGKTWATVALMQYFKQQGKSVVGMKPVASGCVRVEGQLRNEDALLLQQHASVPVNYAVVNPYAYELPVSPHIAGQENPVDVAVVLHAFQHLASLADVILVEGAGGWYVPINQYQDISDLALTLGLPVILVVAIKLGCINHARLSLQAIQYKGLPCAGWVAVALEPQLLCFDAVLATLQAQLSVPLLASFPYMEVMDSALMANKVTW
jgi:dethiobiotin synthetase